MKNFIIFILLAISSLAGIRAQEEAFSCFPNLIQNGSFEKGKNGSSEDNSYQEGWAYYDDGILGKQFWVENWKSWASLAFPGGGTPKRPCMASPDWYNESSFFTPNNAVDGSRMTGMTTYELIRQKLNTPLDGSKTYRMSLWVFPDLVWGTWSDFFLEVMVSNTKVKYKKVKDGDDETACETLRADPDYINLDVNTRISYQVNLDNIQMNVWNNIVIYIDGPSNFNADHLAVELTHKNGSQRTPINNQPGQPYIFLDDLTLREMCPSLCDPFNSCPSVASNNQVNPASPLTITGLSGLHMATVNIYNAASQLIFQDNSPYCVNGLDDVATYPLNFADGFYYLQVIGYNSCIENKQVYYRQIQVINNGFAGATTSMQCDPAPVMGPYPCCESEPDIVFNNHTFNNPLAESYHAINSVQAGTNSGSVIVNSPQLVEFKAGSFIRLGEGFRVADWATFLATIEDCGVDQGPDFANQILLVNYLPGGDLRQKSSLIEEIAIEQNNLDGEILVYPNPTEDQLQVEVTSGNIKRVSIFNTEGVLLKQYQEGLAKLMSISIGNFPNGLYVIKVETNDGNFKMHKVIKQ